MNQNDLAGVTYGERLAALELRFRRELVGRSGICALTRTVIESQHDHALAA